MHKLSNHLLHIPVSIHVPTCPTTYPFWIGIRCWAKHILQPPHSARDQRDGEDHHKQDERSHQHAAQVALPIGVPQMLPVNLLRTRRRLNLRAVKCMGVKYRFHVSA